MFGCVEIIFANLSIDFPIKSCKNTVFIFGSFFARIQRVTEEALVGQTAVWPIPFLINMLNALEGSQVYFICY